MFFIQMSGFPGSGKSTLALEIANRTGCIIVDHDVAKSALLKAAENGELAVEATGKLAYGIDFSLVDFYLSQGRDVILDSPCLYGEIVERGMLLAEKYKANYKFIECRLDSFEEINHRLKNRKRRASQISEATSVENFHLSIKSSRKPENISCLLVNSGEPLDTYISEVMGYICH